MDYSDVVIRFIREGVTCPAKDHLLRIKRNKECFMWWWSEENRQKTQFIEFKNGAAVLKALERMFHLLSWDVDPYENIQVVVPAYPMILLKVAELKETWPTLQPFLEDIFENWPVNTTSKLVRENDDDMANPAFDLEDADEDEEDAEEDEDAEEEDADDDRTDPDMPALVSSEDETAQIVGKILRLVQGRLEPQRVSNATTTNATNWIEEGEVRQKREPIEIRRVVNTPNGPRTHIRFV